MKLRKEHDCLHDSTNTDDKVFYSSKCCHSQFFDQFMLLWLHCRFLSCLLQHCIRQGKEKMNMGKDEREKNMVETRGFTKQNKDTCIESSVCTVHLFKVLGPINCTIVIFYSKRVCSKWQITKKKKMVAIKG